MLNQCGTPTPTQHLFQPTRSVNVAGIYLSNGYGSHVISHMFSPHKKTPKERKSRPITIDAASEDTEYDMTIMDNSKQN